MTNYTKMTKSELIEEVKSLEAQIQEESVRCSKAIEENKVLRKDNEALSDELKDRNEACAKLIAEKEMETTEKVTNLQSAYNALESELTAITEENAMLRATNRLLESKLKAATDALDLLADRCVEDTDEVHKDEETSIDDLCEVLDKLTDITGINTRAIDKIGKYMDNNVKSIIALIKLITDANQLTIPEEFREEVESLSEMYAAERKEMEKKENARPSYAEYLENQINSAARYTNLPEDAKEKMLKSARLIDKKIEEKGLAAVSFKDVLESHNEVWNSKEESTEEKKEESKDSSEDKSSMHVIDTPLGKAIIGSINFGDNKEGCGFGQMLSELFDILKESPNDNDKKDSK